MRDHRRRRPAGGDDVGEAEGHYDAYGRVDEKKQQLRRVYGTAFYRQEDLDA